MKIDVTNSQDSTLKKIMYTIVFALLTWSSLFAQDVRETSRAMSLGSQNAFYVDIDNVDADFAEDVWKDYMKEYGKVKRNRKAKEFYSVDAEVRTIRAEKINTYTKFEEGKNQVSVYMWVDLGGFFANSNENPAEAQGVRTFLEGYRVAVLKEYYTRQYKKQEKVVKKSKRTLSKLEKKNKSLHDDIEKLKKRIVEKEEDIVKNLKEQEDQKMKILSDERDAKNIQDKLNAVGKE